jgi:ADP-ribose pyrophosphatase
MRILDVQKLTDEKWVNLFAARFDHNGHAGRWVFASRRADPRTPPPAAGDAVVIVPVLREARKKPRLVMIQEFRVPAFGHLYAFPAGLLEPGEDVEAAVRRELREETGLEVTAVKKVSPAMFASAGLTDETAHLVFVDAAPGGGKPSLEASEELEVVTLAYAEACRLCDDETARFDVRAWTVLYLYQLLGKFV